MRELLNTIRRLLRNTHGATSIEYGLLAALLAIAIIVSAASIGSQLNDNFIEVSESFPDMPE